MIGLVDGGNWEKGAMRPESGPRPPKTGMRDGLRHSTYSHSLAVPCMRVFPYSGYDGGGKLTEGPGFGV